MNSSRAFSSLAESNAFFEQLVTNVEAIPGVETAGLIDAIPLGRNRAWSLAAPGLDYDGNPSLPAFPHIVDHRYLEAMRIPLLAGRHFSAHDTPEKTNIVVLNESAAKAVFHGQEALGRTVEVAGEECQVVGVVADVRHQSLELGSGFQMYLPFTQNGDFEALDMVVRSRLPAHVLAKQVTAAFHAVDPTLPTGEYQSLAAIVERAVSPRRFTLQLLGAFSATALLLAALGIYGVLSYSVSERRREIGIRMALGETTIGVQRRVVGRTLALAAIGIVIGTLGSLVASRWVAALLYGVEPMDPATFLRMVVVLVLVSAAAGFLPAWRASRTDVVAVLQPSD